MIKPLRVAGAVSARGTATAIVLGAGAKGATPAKPKVLGAPDVSATKPPEAIVLGACEGAIRRHWPKELQSTALAVSWQESSLVASKHNWNPATGDDSWGCFQGNRYGVLGASRPSPEWLVNADNNASWAYQMYRWHGWEPWHNTAIRLGLLK